jgi:hypothetical protein
MWKSLIDTGEAGVAILAAYTVKEALRSLLALTGTNLEPQFAVVSCSDKNYMRRNAIPDSLNLDGSSNMSSPDWGNYRTWGTSGTSTPTGKY